MDTARSDEQGRKVPRLLEEGGKCWQEKTVAPLRRRNGCSLPCARTALNVVNQCGLLTGQGRTVTTLQGICRLTHRGRPVSQSTVPTLSLRVSTRRRGKMGCTTRRVWAGCDCSAWHVALYRSSEHSCASIRPCVIE